MKRLLTATLVAASSLVALGQPKTVLLQETFDDLTAYSVNFPTIYDNDRLLPGEAVSSIDIFTRRNDAWHICCDDVSSTDMWMTSHSCYKPAGTSDDWLTSRPVAIPGEGFTLAFDAQSLIVGSDLSKLSSLWVFVTDYAPVPAEFTAEPDLLLQDISYGSDPQLAEIDGDWTHATLDLSKWAGRTVYISFVNRNTDKEILCLNNVEVYCENFVELTASSSPYVSSADYTVDVLATGVADPASHPGEWTMTFADGVTSSSLSFPALAVGESFATSFSSEIASEETRQWTVSITDAAGEQLAVAFGTVARAAFTPEKRVLFEDCTGMSCGNCVGGIYVIEELEADPNMEGRVIPVGVHLSSFADPLACNHGSTLGFTAAPTFLIDRYDITGMSGIDMNAYDPTREGTLAYRVAQRLDAWTPLDVSVAGEWVRDENDAIVGINATATVRSAIALAAHSYRLGFILVENNVSNETWVQSNYASGLPYESGLNGWTQLPEYVLNVRFQDVSRGLWGDLTGFEGSIPASLAAGQEASYDFYIPLPDTYATDARGVVTSPAIRPEYCSVVATVIDASSLEVANAAICPMSDVAGNKFNTADLLREYEQSGIVEVAADGVEAEYFDLQGRRVANPANGLYIVRRGSAVEKILIR